MKSLIFILFIALATQAHASTAAANGGHHGGLGSAMGSAHGAAAAASGGNGGRYSMVDDFQPWPQSQMQNFQKPHWTPYKGE